MTTADDALSYAAKHSPTSWDAPHIARAHRAGRAAATSEWQAEREALVAENVALRAELYIARELAKQADEQRMGIALQIWPAALTKGKDNG